MSIQNRDLQIAYQANDEITKIDNEINVLRKRRLFLSSQDEHSLFSHDLHELQLTIRVHNTLTLEGIFSVGDLAKMIERELSRIPHFGKRSMVEVKDMLRVMYGISLGMTDNEIANYKHTNSEQPTDRFAMGTPGVAHADKDGDS